MHLSVNQKLWFDKYIFPSIRKKYDEVYKRYQKFGGNLSQDRISRFFSCCKGSKGEIAPLPSVEASKALKAVGLSLQDMRRIDEIMLEGKVDDRFITDDHVLRFYQECATCLWDNGNNPSAQDYNDTLLKLLDCVVTRNQYSETTDENVLQERNRLLFFDLCDYLLENRQDERWEYWMAFISCAYNLHYFTNIDHGFGYVDWFEGCRIYFPDKARNPDGCPRIESDRGKLARVQESYFDDKAYMIRCVNLMINRVRHVLFSHTVQIERTFAKIATLHRREPQFLDLQSSLRKHIKDCDRLREQLRNAFGEVNDLIRPVWWCIADVGNNHKWLFLLSCARLFADYAKYHYYSSAEKDKEDAIAVFQEIIEVSTKYSRILESTIQDFRQLEIRCRFLYLEATANRYIAEYHTSKKEIDKAKQYIDCAVEAACKADELVQCAKELPDSTKKRLEYRMKRHHARILTFAIRWWLRHGRPDIRAFAKYLQKKNERDDQELCSQRKSTDWCHGPVCIDYSQEEDDKVFPALCSLKKATELCHDSICKPIYGGGVRLTLSNKRKLEWEFHLRTMIEFIVADIHEKNEQDGGIEIEEVEAAILIIIRIYCYLFPVKNSTTEVWRPFTHVTPSIASSAKKMLQAMDEDGDKTYIHDDCDAYFDYTLLDGIRQNEPPSPTCQFETLNAILYDFTRRPFTKDTRGRVENRSVIRKIIEEAKDSPFYKQVWLPFYEALKKDEEHLVALFKSEQEAFNLLYEKKVVKSNHHPYLRHKNEMLCGPGSSAKDIAQFFSFHKLSIGE